MDFDKGLWPEKESKKPLGERRTPQLKQPELTRGFGAQQGLEPSPQCESGLRLMAFG